MLNLRVLEVVEYLDDAKVVVLLDGRNYTRKVRKTISDQDIVKINNREFLV